VTAVAQESDKKLLRTAIEIGKWVLVFWLLLPIRGSMQARVDFSRVMLGVLLAVLFIGKRLYDTVIDGYKKNRERSDIVDFLATVAIVVLVAALVGAILVFGGMFVIYSMQEMQNEQ
jgi:hypothetical protein